MGTQGWGGGGGIGCETSYVSDGVQYGASHFSHGNQVSIFRR